MKKILTLLLVLFAFASYGQIIFEKGYFIDHDGKRIDCLIKNNDWFNSPSEFKYKLSSESEVQTASIESVMEFAMANSKYIRSTVEIDRSGTDARKFDYDKNPKWTTEALFLKVIVEGKANLYVYRGKDLEKFFFNVDGAPIKQLIYKIYLSNNATPRDGTYLNKLQMRYNATYLNQLENNLTCGTFSIKDLQKVKYDTKSLKDYFIKYNKCSQVEPIDFERKENSIEKLHLKISPGLDFSSLLIYTGDRYWHEKFRQTQTFRLGFEAEMILPFNKNKWGIILEPTYQSYKPHVKSIDYKSIEIPLGLRHYFFLNENLKLFMNGSAVFDIPLNYSLEWSNIRLIDAKTKYGFNIAAGAGLSYEKFTFEGRYYTNRIVNPLDSRFEQWFLNYKKFALIIGYRIF